MDFLNSVFGRGGNNADNNNENSNDGNNSNNSGGNGNNSNNDNNNNSGNNNNDNNVDKNTSVWDTGESNKNNSGEQNQNNQQQQNSNNDQQIDPKQQLRNHLDGLNLGNNLDLTKISEDLQQGNTESIGAALQTVAENVYQAAVRDLNGIMTNKFSDMETQIQSNTEANINSNLAVSEMKNKIPMASDPNFEPVAIAALNAQMKAGKSLNEAIKGVQGFFATVANNVNNQNNNEAGNQSFNSSANSNNSNNSNSNNNNSNSNNNLQSSHNDWLDTLSH